MKYKILIVLCLLVSGCNYQSPTGPEEREANYNIDNGTTVKGNWICLIPSPNK